LLVEMAGSKSAFHDVHRLVVRGVANDAAITAVGHQEHGLGGIPGIEPDAVRVVHCLNWSRDRTSGRSRRSAARGSSSSGNTSTGAATRTASRAFRSGNGSRTAAESIQQRGVLALLLVVENLNPSHNRHLPRS